MEGENKLKSRIEKGMKIYFKIGYNNTEANKRVHEAFVTFCEHETDGGYLQGIKKLLEFYTLDWKYATLKKEIQELKEDVEKHREQPIQVEEEESKETKTFGGKER